MSCREEEDLAQKAKDELAKKDNLWESVGDMVDMQASVGKDVSRMKSVMVHTSLFCCCMFACLIPPTRQPPV